jgi:cyanoexosortase A
MGEIQRFWQNSSVNFWLLACSTAIATFHLNLIWRAQITIGQSAVATLVGWLGIIYLLWQKQKLPMPEFKVPAWMRGIGIVLLCWMITRALLRRGSLEVISIFYPLLAITGLLLMAVGWQGIKEYKWEFIISAFLSMPLGTIDFIAGALKIPVIDAQIATFVLHYLGFTVMREGTAIYLPGGAVEIASACSSFSTIISILILLFSFLIVFPISRVKQLILILLTIVSVLIVNGFRMGLLAVLISRQELDSFQYWHGAAGAEIFSNISIMAVAGWGYLLLRQNPELEEEDDDFEMEQLSEQFKKLEESQKYD